MYNFLCLQQEESTGVNTNIENGVKAAKNKPLVIVIKGSGKLADLLAHYVK